MRFATLPLRHKLTLLVTLTSALVLGLACAILAAYDLRRAYRDLETDLVSLAQLIGAESTGALTFDDARAAEDILAAMRARTHIVSARLYDAKGRPFATYRRKGAEGEALPEHPLPDSYRASRSDAVLFESVRLGTETAGTLYLKADLGELRSHFEGYLAIVLLVMVASVALATVLSARWQHLVIAPILRLSDAAGAVTRDKDYSVRVPSAGADELGVLTSAFNEMLSEIEHRDAVLRAEVKERQHAEDQLRQAQKMEAVGRLAGGVAHDFNNLLGVILGYSEMVLRDPSLGPLSQRKVEQIQKAGNRAAALTRQLLAFSRKQVLAPKVLDLNALLVEFARMLPRVLGEDVELVVVEGKGLGQVKADPGQLEQILMNLCVNGRDAMPEGGRITVSTANVHWQAQEGGRPGPFVMLAVSDTGVGMDAATRSHVFEPFFTTKPQGKGTGLGLATVYGIMTQSEGHIEIDSAPGKGTTFRLYFPRIDEKAETPVAARAQPERRGTETILLVEDEAALRDLIAGMLRDRGYTVLVADCGPEALLLDDGHPGRIDLLLSDVIMPGMSGPQVALEMTRRRPTLKVVFLSGYSDEALGARGVLDPGTVLLPKPFSGAALDLCLTQVLGVRPEVPRNPQPKANETAPPPELARRR